MIDNWWLFILGVLALFIYDVIKVLLYSLKWSLLDTWRLFNMGELKEGVDKYQWFIILPKQFCRKFINYIFEYSKGWRYKS